MISVLCTIFMAQRRDGKLLRQIAERLREIRKELKITQDTVIEDTGVSIANIEAGSMNLTIMTIAILCEYYEVTLEEFFKGINLPTNLQ